MKSFGNAWFRHQSFVYKEKVKIHIRTERIQCVAVDWLCEVTTDRSRVFHLSIGESSLFNCLFSGCHLLKLSLSTNHVNMSFISKSYNLRGQALSAPLRRFAAEGRRTLATLQEKPDVQGRA
jgi:hypothetical protein